MKTAYLSFTRSEWEEIGSALETKISRLEKGEYDAPGLPEKESHELVRQWIVDLKNIVEKWNAQVVKNGVY